MRERKEKEKKGVGRENAASAGPARNERRHRRRAGARDEGREDESGAERRRALSARAAPMAAALASDSERTGVPARLEPARFSFAGARTAMEAQGYRRHGAREGGGADSERTLEGLRRLESEA